MDLNASHKMLRFRNEVTQICRPLFDNTAISYFEYARYYQDGRFFELNSNADITLRYVNQRCYPDAAEIGTNTTKYVLMSPALPLPKATKGIEEKYISNIKIFEAEKVIHRLYTQVLKEDYYEVCGFGTNIESGLALELFFNNLDFWDRFKQHFVSKANKLIKEQYSHRIQLPVTRPELIDEVQLQHQRKLTNIQGIPLENNHIINDVKLGSREYTVLKELAHGKTAKEIALALSISSRTVQTHIERIKQKFNVHYKSELAELFWQSK